MTTSLASTNGHSSNGVASSTPTAGALNDYLALHRDFLASQLGVGQRLTELLSAEIGSGSPRKDVLDSIGAVAWQSVALGQAHANANNALNTLAGGTAIAAPPTESAAPQVPAAPVPVAPVPVAPTPVVNGNGAHATQPAPLVDGSGAHAAQPAPLVNGNGSTQPAPLVNGNGAHAAQPANLVIETPVAPAPAPVAPAPAAPVAPAPAPAAPVAPAAAPAAGLDPATAQRVVFDIVADKTGYPTDMLEPGMEMEADLGVDSIKRVEIMGAMRDQYPSVGEVPMEEIGEIRTLGEITDFLARYGGGAGASGATVAEAAPKA
ncbi:phosphopantetheine-binding protein [Nocardia sp. NPDC051570]|uniref:phosphopantetheine-binding protein n=1 Tax=Nocardia sp. NPDC051570 TaxID=3364324 RepID=UPI0037970BD2